VIDPKNIVRTDWTDAELEELAIFCIAAIGKPSDRMAPAVDKMLKLVKDSLWNRMTGDWTPFSSLETATIGSQLALSILLKEFGITPHKMKGRAIHELMASGFDLRTVTVAQLETIHGIGNKTARFFVMCSQHNVQHAALDTHILKWLHHQGVEFDLPKTLKNRPSGRRYLELEQEFLSRVPEGTTPALFDLEIWTEYSERAKAHVG